MYWHNALQSRHDSHEWVLISAQPQVSTIIHTYFPLFPTIVAATSATQMIEKKMDSHFFSS